MNTQHRFQLGDLAMPASTTWYVSDLGEFRGKQELIHSELSIITN